MSEGELKSAVWRLLVEGAASPAHNMAVDEALLREVRGPVLRLYKWNTPAVSLGYFQPAALAPAGRPFVRRYTGGGLVDHAQDLTYTIVLPRAHGWMELSAPESYRRIHEGVQAVLRACGIGVELTPEASVAESEACFQKPVRFDLVAGAAKLGGAAQRRTREGLLHQGSLLLPEPKRNDEVRRAFPEFLTRFLEVDFAPGELTAEEEERAAKLELERYGTEAWNRMR
jgi:lipoate-protein ligase A